MSDALNEKADWQSHPISGYARAAQERGQPAYFECPLISEILPNLWQGGCVDGVKLPDDFDLVVSLYPWEKYALGPNTERVEIRAYDGADLPDFYDIAGRIVDEYRQGKKILIHCQAGLNRSGLLAAMVLMRLDYSGSEAIALLRSTRSEMVLCNETFENYILGLETE